jgi:predicted MPP superfamily phosphohydrolase
MAVLTDLHSTIYGEHQTELIKAIRAQNPDIILLVGDIADDEVPHDGTRQLLSVIGNEYPCYYVSGNHEYWSDEADAIKKMISSYGVTVLAGETRMIEINHQKLQIGGVDDPEGFKSTPVVDGIPKGWMEQFENCRAETSKEAYSILLSHRPELAEHYRNSGFDLVLAGHSHGGQVRIPGLMNGLIAPNQGWFPKYAGACYQLGSTTMIVSRGLSRSRLPRIFNPPELVMVELMPIV